MGTFYIIWRPHPPETILDKTLESSASGVSDSNNQQSTTDNIIEILLQDDEFLRSMKSIDVDITQELLYDFINKSTNEMTASKIKQDMYLSYALSAGVPKIKSLPTDRIDRREQRRMEQQMAIQNLKKKLTTQLYQPSTLTDLVPVPQKTETISTPVSGAGIISVYMEGVNDPNQDYAVHFTKDNVDFFVLADGVGGRGGGAMASQLLVDFVRQNVSADNVNRAFILHNLLEAADNELFRHQTAGETTAIVIAIKEDMIYGSSVGDSEAWMIENNEVRILTEGQHQKPFIGSQHASSFSFKRYFPYGTLIVGSDGLFKYTQQNNIIQTVQQATMELSSAALANLTRTKSGHLQDDISIILYSKPR